LLSDSLHKLFFIFLWWNYYTSSSYIGIFEDYCSWFFFLWKCTVNQTRDDKSCQLWGTTGTTWVRRFEPWTLSKRFSLERRRLMYFKTITHFHESDSNSKNNWAVSVIKYFGFREVWLFCFSPNKTQIFYINRRLPNVSIWQCDIYTVWQQHSVTASQCDSYTVWQLHSVTAAQCDSYTVWQLHSVTATQFSVQQTVDVLITWLLKSNLYENQHYFKATIHYIFLLQPGV
jgi:hypothetical protein